MRAPRQRNQRANKNVTGASQMEWRLTTHAAIAITQAAEATNPSFEQLVHSESYQNASTC